MSISSTSLASPTPGVDYPGRTLGIVGLVLAILFSIVGMIVSIIAYRQSKDAGIRNIPAQAGIVLGAIFFGVSMLTSFVLAVVIPVAIVSH